MQTGVKPGSLRHLQCAGQFTFSIIDLPYISFSPPGAVGFIEANSVLLKLVWSENRFKLELDQTRTGSN
jgi:hypothetical protein